MQKCRCLSLYMENMYVCVYNFVLSPLTLITANGMKHLRNITCNTMVLVHIKYSYFLFFEIMRDNYFSELILGFFYTFCLCSGHLSLCISALSLDPNGQNE